MSSLEDLREVSTGLWSTYSRQVRTSRGASAFFQTRCFLKTETRKLSSRWIKIGVWHQLQPHQSLFREILTKNFTKLFERENAIIWVSSKWNTEQTVYKTPTMLIWDTVLPESQACESTRLASTAFLPRTSMRAWNSRQNKETAV